MKLLRSLAVGVVFVVSGGMGTAHAIPINGGSGILDQDAEHRVSDWLGQGDIQFTNIFDKATDGATAAEWHQKVDSKGSTVTVMELDNGFIIGGYNERSWDTSGWVKTSGPDYTSFIFSITGNLKATRNASSELDTYNNSSYGAAWGGGYGLFAFSDLTYGQAGIGASYGDGTHTMTAQYRQTFSGGGAVINIVKYETFTVQPYTGLPATVPEPASIALMGLGLVGLGFARRRKAKGLTA